MVARLDALRATVTAAEDDVLACLVVTGEPRPQRVLDDWLDQVADILRGIGEQAADLAPGVARFVGGPARRGVRPDAVAGNLAPVDSEGPS